MVLAGILLVAAVIDIRWLKNRHRIVNKVYVSPTYHGMPPPPSTAPDSGTPCAQNDRLRDVTLIGLGRIEAPEDVILDRHDNLYAGSRHGDIIRFFAPDYERDGGLRPYRRHSRSAWPSTATTISMSASAAWASIASRPSARSRRRPTRPTAACYSVNDDSRLRLADDLDITDDGRIFFSEATVRYEMHEWPVDGLEARGNGRIICYDPNTGTTRTVLRGLKFPNGICIASDGQSILFAETWGCCDQALLVRRPEDRQDRDR